MMAVCFGNPFQPGSILWDHRGFFNTTFMGFLVGIAVPEMIVELNGTALHGKNSM
jgi:hypothetical protein